VPSRRRTSAARAPTHKVVRRRGFRDWPGSGSVASRWATSAGSGGISRNRVRRHESSLTARLPDPDPGSVPP